MEMFDLVVIGSGPGGSATAMTGRKLGLTVAIVDKATFPRDKLCGGLFTGRSEKAMRRIFGLEVTPDRFVTSQHMRFSAKGEVLAEITDAPPVHLTMRRDLDAMLHAHAVEAGAVPYLGNPLSEIDFDANEVTLRDDTKISFKALIGADSVNSMVARLLFGRPFNPDTIGFGLEVETPQTNSRDGAVEVDFEAANWGYGWSFPKHKTVTVGVGGINTQNADMKAAMRAYVDQTQADPELKYKGQYIPFGDYRKSPGRGNVLLVGDAAGLVDPVTGEGIALAMESGDYAARAVYEALQANEPATALDRYLALLKPIHRGLDQAKQWRLVMFPKLMQSSFKKAFRQGGSLQRKYLDLLAGEVEYSDLRTAFLKRIPKFLWWAARNRVMRLFGSHS